MAKDRRLDFDWITISYRTIWTVAGVVAVLLAAGIYVSVFGSRNDVESRLRNMEFKLEDISGRIASQKALQLRFQEAVESFTLAKSAVQNQDTARARSMLDAAQAIINEIETELDRLASGYTARIVSVEGRVSIKRAGDFRWLDARSGTELKEGDRIQAGSQGSAEIVYLNGDRLTLMPNCLAEIFESQVDPETSAERLGIRISGGETGLKTALKRKQGSYTHILTEKATVEVGMAETDLLVDARKDSTQVKVLSGSSIVLKDTTGVKRDVDAQKVGIVGEKGFTIRDLPPPPKLLAPEHGEPIVISGDSAGAVTMRWEIDPRAKRYHLQMSNSKFFAVLLIDSKEVRPDRNGVQLKGLTKGTYYWRVAVIDEDGSESSFSETRNFRVGAEPVSAQNQPSLSIDTPLPIGRFLMVRGKTDAGVYLTINGKRVDVRDDGSFEDVVQLDRLGENQVKLVAQNNAGGRTEKIYTHVFDQ